MSLRLGVDIGGTNTDAVLVNGADRVVARAKTPTTPDVISGIRAALGKTITERRDWLTSVGQQVRTHRIDPATLPEPIRQKIQ